MTIRETETLARVKAVILLAGSIRSTPFLATIGRSMLDLPMAKGRTLLGLWRGHVARLSEAAGWTDVPIRVIVDASSPLPASLDGDEGPELLVERDPLEYRGTAGVLRDACMDYKADDLVLVANSSQPPRGGLFAPVRGLAAAGADISVVVPRDGTPSNLMLIRSGALAGVAKVGFVDLKEQAIPAIAKRHRVVAVPGESSTTPPIRGLGDYIHTVRDLHLGRLDEAGQSAGPFDEEWRPAFALVEEGALVDPTAAVHDSVVLAGARVGPGASLVRSLVGPRGVVPRGRLVIGDLVGAPGRPGGKSRRAGGGE